MKIVVASDSFKGTLTSIRASQLVEMAARELSGEHSVIMVPVADGGEGTVDSVVMACGGSKESARVHDPLMNEIDAFYGVLGGGRAVIEMAAASGLTLVPEGSRDPLAASSYGTGELIKAALDSGARDISIGIGGSATNDGGMGALTALGAVFKGKDGRRLRGMGSDLAEVSSIDLSGIDRRLREARITVMCDVNNPLTGPDGATYVYGPQKGAGREKLEILERGMCNYRDVIKKLTGMDCDRISGAGAAGGMGAALTALLGAELKPGIETVLDLADFDNKINGADLVITGEGRADAQSVKGKAMYGVARRASAQAVPVIAIAGCLGEGWESLLDCGIDRIITLAGGPVTEEEAMEHAEELYFKAVRELLLTMTR